MTCPKCGTDDCWRGPKYTYVDSLRGREHERLEFECSVCGYTRNEPTKDAPKIPYIPEGEPDTMGVTVLRSPETRKRKWWTFGLL